MPLFDTHAHFDTFDADGTTAAVLSRAAAAGVERLCAVGSSAASNALCVRLAESDPARILAAVGYDREQLDPAARDLPALRTLAARPCVRAIGEIGLDYHYSPDTARPQRALFESMLALALDLALPVVVHSREADADTLAMLRDYSDAWRASVSPTRSPGVLHCFTGGPAFADGVLERGLMVSFSGILTFRNAAPLRDIASRIPADRLLVETDCPYLAPIPHRGETNEPAYVALVADTLAALRATTPSAIASLTFSNATRFFSLPSVP
jgi:TatD DNase family protein